VARVIPFPEGGRNRPTQDPEYDPILVHIQSASSAFDIEVGACTEAIHNFDQVPGRCRCGKHFWHSLDEPLE
jgi:hypothetical protein